VARRETHALSWDEELLRRQFPQTEAVAYLNTGTVGLCPLPVVDALIAQTRAFETSGLLGWGAAEAAMNEARARLAALLGARPDDLVLTRNATDGTNMVTTGIDWRPGDEVLLSAEEHPSMELPWHYLQQLGRIRLRRFPVYKEPERTLAAVVHALTPRTRLVAISHVFSHSGNRAPAAALAALCQDRGVLLHLDGAQAVGQFPIDLSALGADFYAGNCHKWLLGPKGTGFLYLRPGSETPLRPVHVGAGSASAFSWEAGLTLTETARRFEYATRDFAKYAALVPLFDWWDALGWERSQEQMRGLTSALKRRLREMPGLRLHTADEWEHASAMTTFSIPGRTCHAVGTFLWERHQLLTRPVGEWQATRISTAVYNTLGEVDRVVDALHELVRGSAD
jgi:selenocysteine lyase/cysteine desulfurase